jgi:hypothetical protein
VARPVPRRSSGQSGTAGEGSASATNPRDLTFQLKGTGGRRRARWAIVCAAGRGRAFRSRPRRPLDAAGILWGDRSDLDKARAPAFHRPPSARACSAACASRRTEPWCIGGLGTSRSRCFHTAREPGVASAQSANANILDLVLGEPRCSWERSTRGRAYKGTLAAAARGKPPRDPPQRHVGRLVPGGTTCGGPLRCSASRVSAGKAPSSQRVISSRASRTEPRSRF